MEHCNDIILQTHLTNLQYFFSTVTQVLGAILAITGAFVVFKLDKLKISLDGSTQLVLDRWRHGRDDDSVYRSVFAKEEEIENFRAAKLRGDTNQIKRILKGKSAAVQWEIEFDKYKGERLAENFSEIITRVGRIEGFKSASILTYKVNGAILAILIAIFLFIPEVYRSTFGYWSTLIFGLALTILSLWLIIRFLIKSL